MSSGLQKGTGNPLPAPACSQIQQCSRFCETIKISRASVIQQFFDRSFIATLNYLRLGHDDSSFFLDKKYFFGVLRKFLFISLPFLNAFVDFTAVRLKYNCVFDGFMLTLKVHVCSELVVK